MGQGGQRCRGPDVQEPGACPQALDEALKYCNYVFTIVFVVEAVLKLVAFGFRRFFKDRCVGRGRWVPWPEPAEATVLSRAAPGDTRTFPGDREGNVEACRCSEGPGCWGEALAGTEPCLPTHPGGTSWTWPSFCCPLWASRWRRSR